MTYIQGTTGYTYANWFGRATCKPKLYFEPEDAEHVQQVIQKANELGQHVRVVGSGHSNNDLVSSKDYLLSLHRMNKILKVDKSAMTIKAEGGAKMKDIVAALEEQGLALTIFGSAPDATVAGSICTGTHKTGLNYRCISYYVVELELMTADGITRTVSRLLDEELFRACALSVGTMGVILSVTLQCEPAYRLQERHVQVQLDHVLGDMRNIARGSEHTGLVWTPFVGAVLKYVNRTEKTEPRKKTSLFRHIIFGGYLLEFFFWMSTIWTGMLSWVNRKVFRYLLAPPTLFVGTSAQVFFASFPKRSRYMEWSVPLDHASEALRDLRDWIYKEKFPVHMMVSVHFIGEDDFYLSMANGRDICSIVIMMLTPYGKEVEYKPYWKALRDICLKRGGRFHWSVNPDLTVDQIAEVYPDLKKFHEIRKRMDPNGRFLTPEMARLTAA